MATLADNYVEVSLTFTFNSEGFIETVSADDRSRSVNGVMVPTPWQGRFWNYREYDGMLVPVEGEVAWLLPDGALPYWRGRINRLDYSWAR